MILHVPRRRHLAVALYLGEGGWMLWQKCLVSLPPSLSRPLLDYMEGMTMAQTEVDELDRMVLPLLGNSAFVAQTFRARFDWKKIPLKILMKVQFEKEICINY